MEEPKSQGPAIPEELPLVPVMETVIYPLTVMPLAVAGKRFSEAVDEAMSKDRIIAIFGAREKEGVPADEAMFRVGTAGIIHKLIKLPDGGIRLIVQGLEKITVTEFTQKEPYPRGTVSVVKDDEEKTRNVEALLRTVEQTYQRILSLTPQVPEEVKIAAANIDEPLRLVYFIGTMLKLTLEERQELLELDKVEEKLRRLSFFLGRELEILELSGKIHSEVQQEISKLQKEHYLREQLSAIKKELGEESDVLAEITKLRGKMEGKEYPEYVGEEIEKEISRFSMLTPASAEYSVIRTYLDWLVELPWMVSTEMRIDLVRARRILDEDHYDLKDVKERIIEYLALLEIKPDVKAPLLCFTGPPGVGKTSLGKSIAKALGKKFYRLSLGGMRDEAEIRGHRRTYVGALPGRIIQGLKRAATNNPVFMLDEIDKLGADFRGDPSSALLEVLDPEQNAAFSDHYLEIPFDLSKVTFITTANMMDTIQPALRDRMEIIRLSGYTNEEKLFIAKRHLVPRQLGEHGLSGKKIGFTDKGMRYVIAHYTREAGVRNLERQIAKVIRKVAVQSLEGKKGKVTITHANAADYLGPELVFPEVASRTDRPGVATGLAWTEAGGEILFVEAAIMPGRKNLQLTGNMGEVMQESVRAALSYIRSNAKKLRIKDEFFETHDVHIHVPQGAIPKDGPSAGVTMAVALASIIKGKPIRHDVAMTGEITLTGQVLPVGGIKEKTLAAKRAGITTIVLPEKNKNDMEEIDPWLRNGINFVFVRDVSQAFRHVFAKDGTAKKRTQK
jgi:ATP-dependent Lon protease